MKKLIVVIVVLVVIYIITAIAFGVSYTRKESDYNDVIQRYEDSIHTLEVKCDALMEAVENAKGEIIYRDSVRVEIITRYEKEYININHASNAELDSIIRANI